MALSPSAQALPNIDKLAAQGKHKEIIAVCNAAIKKNSKDWKAYGIRGWANCRLNNYQKTVEDCNRAIAINKNYAVFKFRGLAYHLLKDPRAIADLEQAALLMPQNKWAYENLANCYCDLEMHKERVAVLTKALSLEPKNERYFYGRCYSHLQLKEYDSAINDAKSVLKLVPPDHVFAGWAYWRIAEAQFKLGSLDQSIDSCNKALDLCYSPEIYELRSLVREKRGEDARDHGSSSRAA